MPPDGVAVGLLPSSLIIDFCVCVCACVRAHKPLCWFCYLGDMFVVWCHGLEKLQRFLDHLSSVCQNVWFTMETEKGGHLTFQSTDMWETELLTGPCSLL
jgi:hypothetical protein